MNRAYSTLDIKSVDDEQRIIVGVASTPSLDSQGDIMVSSGAKFTLPLPLLWQHRKDQPIGQVVAASVTSGGIEITAQIAKGVLPFIEDAWALIKSGLVRGLSIGWRPLAAPTVSKTATTWTSWAWHELSAVTIPANQEASILAVKAADAAALGDMAASGRVLPTVVELPVVFALKDAPRMTTQEQITSFENTRAAKAARMVELMAKAAELGATLDEKQSEEYDGLEREVAAVDAHLVRLRALEKQNLAAATAVTTTTSTKTASELRGGSPVITVTANVPPGTAFTRYVMAKIAGKGSDSDAIRFVEGNKQWMDQTPEVALALKAAVNPGTIAEPAWAAPLAVARPMANEFLELLRPETLIGKIPGLRRVPFNVSMPIQTGGGTYAWVGEGAPKPVGNLQFASATLGIAKSAGIIVISEELAKISSPSAESVVRNDMIKGMAQFLDTQFIDPTVAAVTNVSPASITNASVSIGSAGTSADNARTDIKALIASFVAANQSVANAVLVMSESNAFALSVALNPLGQPLYPGLTAKGGSILGITTVTSQVASTTVALVQPNEILFADDGGVNIDVSREASLEMNTTPTSPPTASNVMVSLWQQNLIGLRAERFINWKRARLAAVRYTTATYV